MSRIVTERHLIVEADGTEHIVPAIGDFIAEIDETRVTKMSDGKVLVSYLAQDEVGWDYDWQEGVEWIAFDNGHDRDEWREKNEETYWAENPGRVFWVERYEHGLVRYALMGESSQVDRQWDVAPGVAVIVIPEDFTPPYEDVARGILEEYTSWCNGDIYGVVHVWLNANATVLDDEIEHCWGLIGRDYAEQTLDSEHRSRSTNSEGR